MFVMSMIYTQIIVVEILHVHSLIGKILESQQYTTCYLFVWKHFDIDIHKNEA